MIERRSDMHHVRLFRHIKAEYTCTACQRGRTEIASCISPLHMIVVSCAALPVAIAVLLHNGYLPWWQSILAVLAGELLALFTAGFVATVIMAFRSRGTDWCRECGGRMSFAGQHFDPAGDRDPHASDLVILTAFALFNVLFWIAFFSDRLAA